MGSRRARAGPHDRGRDLRRRGCRRHPYLQRRSPVRRRRPAGPGRRGGGRQGPGRRRHPGRGNRWARGQGHGDTRHPRRGRRHHRCLLHPPAQGSHRSQPDQVRWGKCRHCRVAHRRRHRDSLQWRASRLHRGSHLHHQGCHRRPGLRWCSPDSHHPRARRVRPVLRGRRRRHRGWYRHRHLGSPRSSVCRAGQGTHRRCRG